MSDEFDRIAADLSAYLDGELPPPRAAQLERLLARSPEYRRQLEELRGVCEMLGRLPRLKAPERLLAALRRQAERRMLFGEARPSGRSVRLFVRLMAAAAVLGVCVLAGWRLEVLRAGRSGQQIGTAPAQPVPMAAKPGDRQRNEAGSAAVPVPDLTVSEAAPVGAEAARAGGTVVAARPPTQPQLELFGDEILGSIVEVLVRPADEAQRQQAYALLADAFISRQLAQTVPAQDERAEEARATAVQTQVIQVMRRAELPGFVSALAQRAPGRVYVQAEGFQYLAPVAGAVSLKEPATVPVLDESALQSMQSVLDRVWELRRAQARRPVTVRVIVMPPEGPGTRP